MKSSEDISVILENSLLLQEHERNGTRPLNKGDIHCITPLLDEGDGETIKEKSDTASSTYGGQKYLDDPISYAIGDSGRWQFTLTFLLSLFNFPCTWHIFSATFQATPGGDYWCARPSYFHDMPVSEWKNISETTVIINGKRVYNPCVIKDIEYENYTGISHEIVTTKSCHNWEFAVSAVGDTIVSEWDLVCDREQLCNLAEMMFLLGVALGGFFSGLVSDRFGRKKTLMSSLVLQIIFGISLAFVPWFQMFLVIKTMLGFVCVSIVFSGFVLCVELVGGRWITISGVLYLLPVPLSYIVIAGIAYVVHGWRNLQLAISTPSILFLALWWILPESPRWLLTMGRTEEAMKVLQEAARVNKKPLPSNIDKILKQKISSTDDLQKGRVLDLFRTPTMRLISFILYIVWFSVYLVYYGLVLNLSNIGGDVYINSVISGLVEVPSIGLSIIILLKMGRRIPLCFTMFFAGVACLLTLVVPDDGKNWSWLTITFAMMGKFLISSSNVIMPVYTAELFPTVIRNLGVGSSNVPAGIALMIVPYLWNMKVLSAHLPMIVLGVISIGGGMSVLLLPETADQGLSNTLQEKLPIRDMALKRYS